MSSGHEGMLTLTIKMRVSPEPSSFQELISLLRTATGSWNVLNAVSRLIETLQRY